MTSQWACFGIWGPRARDVLEPLTPADLGNEAFPYMSLREITVGDVPVRALRVTYVGELGWELYCPASTASALWRAIWEEGEPHGIVGGGYRAIDSMRLEKGYRVWGADITPDETPYEGGVGLLRQARQGGRVHRPGGALGGEGSRPSRSARAACCSRIRARSRSATSRCGSTARSRGRVTTGGYGYTVGRSIAYAYVPPEHADPGTAVAVEIFGRWVDGEVAREPLFDPEGRADSC